MFFKDGCKQNKNNVRFRDSERSQEKTVYKKLLIR
jgi:hypothetical protein